MGFGRLGFVIRVLVRVRSIVLRVGVFSTGLRIGFSELKALRNSSQIDFEFVKREFNPISDMVFM